MQQLPVPVKTTLERIKKEHKYGISVARKKSGFYLYEIKSVMHNRVKTNSILYLGKIDFDGNFIQAKHRKQETNAKSLEEAIILKQEKKNNPIDKAIYPDNTDLLILEAISANGRASIAEIADYANTTIAVAQRRLRYLEETFSISYVPEFGPRPFNFSDM